jgi:hypothetical protein
MDDALEVFAVQKACMEAIRFIGFTLYRTTEVDERYLAAWQWDGVAARMKAALDALEAVRQLTPPRTKADMDAADIREVEARG